MREQRGKSRAGQMGPSSVSFVLRLQVHASLYDHSNKSSMTLFDRMVLALESDPIEWSAK